MLTVVVYWFYKQYQLKQNLFIENSLDILARKPGQTESFFFFTFIIKSADNKEKRSLFNTINMSILNENNSNAIVLSVYFVMRHPPPPPHRYINKGILL